MICIDAQTTMGTMTFYLNDPTATAFTSTALPTSLDPAAFAVRMGRLDNTSGEEIYFSIDTIAPDELRVKIDVKPDDFPNTINPRSRGRLAVAIVTTGPPDNVPTFDATSVEPATVRFGATGTEAAPVHSELEDVDHDGDMDLLFKTQETGIQCGGTSATLNGQTLDGKKFAGTDSIRTVGCKYKEINESMGSDSID